MNADQIQKAIEQRINASGRDALERRAEQLRDVVVSEIASDGSLSDELKAALIPTVGVRVTTKGLATYAVVGFGVAGSGGGRSTRSGKHKSGVGISANNVHWFALGTDDRFTGQRSYRIRGGTARRTVATGKRKHFSGRIQPIRILQRAKGRF